MGAPQYEQAGADIGGTGTTNTIPRWTGPSTLGDSGLIDDGSQIYTTSRVLAVNTATTLGTGLIRFQVGSASALANYQGAQAGFMLPTGSGSWVEFCENSASGTTFRISKDASTGVVLNANGKNIGLNASGYTAAVASSQMVLLTSGNVGIGTSSPSTYLSGTAKLVVLANANSQNSILVRNDNAGSSASAAIALNASGNTWGIECGSSAKNSNALTFQLDYGGANSTKMTLTSTGDVGIGTASPVSRLDVAGTITCDDAATGIKLPATPGNGNANTLDSYQEGTRVLSAGDLSGWTYVTATQYWTLVGRTVTLHTVFTGGTSSATGGATIATPPLLTPLRIAAGAAVNSSGTALGNGVCVVTSTSSTTGTVITSNAISSSAVDKVLTVTYETAGL